MMKKIFISQSNYIPWKGYFDAINQADVFVVYDEMQYTRRDWRNRNKIKTSNGLQWLTIPVSDEYGKSKISEVVIADDRWRKKHLNAIHHNYARSNYFNEVMEWLVPLYEEEYNKLSKVNLAFIKAICNYLDIKTEIRDSAEFRMAGERTEKLVNICAELKADQYITGPSAANYLDEKLFASSNIGVEFLDFSGYLEYPQLYGDFRHNVTILDLLFNVGGDVSAYMKSFQSNCAKLKNGS